MLARGNTDEIVERAESWMDILERIPESKLKPNLKKTGLKITPILIFDDDSNR